jgi:hypothetical protein
MNSNPDTERLELLDVSRAGIPRRDDVVQVRADNGVVRRLDDRGQPEREAFSFGDRHSSSASEHAEKQNQSERDGGRCGRRVCRWNTPGPC